MFNLEVACDVLLVSNEARQVIEKLTGYNSGNSVRKGLPLGGLGTSRRKSQIIFQNSYVIVFL